MKILTGFFFTTFLLFSMHEMNSQKPLFSFGVIADVQYADRDPAGNRYYRSSYDRLREAYETFSADSVSFVINLGDLIDRDYLSFQPVMDIINSYGIKTYHIAGNHDFLVDPRLKNKLPLPSGDDSFYHQNYRFILLNGNELSIYASNKKSAKKKSEELLAKMKTAGEINAMDWNGGISTKQLTWLEKQLDESVANNEKVFILCHFPVFPINVHNLLNYREVLRVLEKYNNIIAWLNGHNHAGNYGNFNMIHFITFRGMVDTMSDNSFATVDIYPNRLWIKGYGREKMQVLQY